LVKTDKREEREQEKEEASEQASSVRSGAAEGQFAIYTLQGERKAWTKVKKAAGGN
jgi:hypothetical protein